MFHQVRSADSGHGGEHELPDRARTASERIDVFSHGGGQRTAEQMKVPFLGELPLDPQVRIGGDTGRPVTAREGEPRAEPFLALARVVDQICSASQSTGPTITIED